MTAIGHLIDIIIIIHVIIFYFRKQIQLIGWYNIDILHVISTSYRYHINCILNVNIIYIWIKIHISRSVIHNYTYMTSFMIIILGITFFLC